MTISNAFLSNNSINRGLRVDGEIFVFTSDGKYTSTKDEEVLKSFLASV